MNDAFFSIIGHARAVARLRRMHANGAFPPVVLFCGPRRVGKRTLAFCAAGALLGAEDPAAHPDFRRLERPRDEKTGKLKKSIPIEAVRGLQEHLRMRAFLGGAKVVVIEEADLLSEEAANAFLKTLEEPTPRTHVLLCAESAERLPKTVLSRAAVIALGRVPESEMASALVGRGISPTEAGQAAARSDGRPGLAIAFREEDGMLDWYASEERRWRSLRESALHRRFAALSDLVPPRSDREETVLKIRAALGLWRLLLRRELRAGESRAAANLRRLQRLEESLDVNVQPRALLERFALTLDRP